MKAARAETGLNICSQLWAVVLAQFVERLLLTPEVRSSNPVIIPTYCQLY